MECRNSEHTNMHECNISYNYVMLLGINCINEPKCTYTHTAVKSVQYMECVEKEERKTTFNEWEMRVESVVKKECTGRGKVHI